MANTPFQKCAAQHFGPWMVYPQWFAQAVAAVKAGTFKPVAEDSDELPTLAGAKAENVYDGDGRFLYTLDRGIARIGIIGQVTKGDSSFGGASTVRARWRIREAVNDGRVTAILLVIDSPGGTVSGTGDLAADIADANRKKCVYAYAEDLCASAAYWIASQSSRIYANPTAQVGSIGTMTYVEDTSGAYEKAGIKVTLIATGKFKGQWIDGNPVSEDYIKEVRTEIEDLNEYFLAGVMAGRKMTREQLMEVADGRVFIADKAKQLGLIDEVASLEAAMQAIYMETLHMNSDQFRAFAAEHPDDEDVKQVRQEGFKAGKADGIKCERDRVVSILDASKNHAGIADKAIRAGMEADQVVLAVTAADEAAAKAKAEAEANAAALAAKDQQIAAMKELLSNQQSGVTVTGATADAGKRAVDFASIADPAKRAEAEWEANFDDCQATFTSKAVYAKARARELRK